MHDVRRYAAGRRWTRCYRKLISRIVTVIPIMRARAATSMEACQRGGATAAADYHSSLRCCSRRWRVAHAPRGAERVWHMLTAGGRLQRLGTDCAWNRKQSGGLCTATELTVRPATVTAGVPAQSGVPAEAAFARIRPHFVSHHPPPPPAVFRRAAFPISFARRSLIGRLLRCS